jgi:hypothetical protein
MHPSDQASDLPLVHSGSSLTPYLTDGDPSLAPEMPSPFAVTYCTGYLLSVAVPPHRGAGFQAWRVAGFQTRRARGSAADLEVGDTAGLETCATMLRNRPGSGPVLVWGRSHVGRTNA